MKKSYFGKSEQIAGFADRCVDEIGFCAYWFVAWCEKYDRTIADVCNELDSGMSNVIRAAIAYAPRKGRCNEDVHAVAAKFGWDRLALARILFLLPPVKPAVKKGK